MSSYARSTKRQYQPQISSYFARAPNTPLSPATHTTLNQPAAEPVILPNHVQASLLSVGMRVRKAVPGGYQTKEKATYTPASAAMPAAPSLPTPARRAELAPYCGINKIGGLGAQPLLLDDDDDFPSSQESWASNASTESVPARLQSRGTANVRKRGMRDEEEEEQAVLDPAFFDHGLWRAGVFDRDGDVLLAERPLAKAVSRRRGAAAPVVVMEDGEDFGEAPFLGAPSDEDMW